MAGGNRSSVRVEEVKSEIPSKVGTAPKKEEIKQQPKETTSAPPVKKPAVTNKTEKDYPESCNKIVENFNKNIIDIGYDQGGDGIQDIMHKAQAYKKHFEEQGITVGYKTKLLDLPEGDDSNLRLLDDIESQDENNKINAKLENIMQDMLGKLHHDPYAKYVKTRDIIYKII